MFQVRKSVTERCKGIKSNVLEVAALRNKPALARFFAEIFYDLGEELNCQDSEEGNTLFHMTARKGDDSAPTMEILLNLRFHEDRKVIA